LSEIPADDTRSGVKYGGTHFFVKVGVA